jgi:hypothetical protein
MIADPHLSHGAVEGNQQVANEKVTLQVPHVENDGCANVHIRCATLSLGATSDRVQDPADGCFRRRIRLFFDIEPVSLAGTGGKSWSGQNPLLKKFA